MDEEVGCWWWGRGSIKRGVVNGGCKAVGGRDGSGGDGWTAFSREADGVFSETYEEPRASGTSSGRISRTAGSGIGLMEVDGSHFCSHGPCNLVKLKKKAVDSH